MKLKFTRNLKSGLVSAVTALAFSSTYVTSLAAADIKAGGEFAEQCAACHGLDGVSTGAKFPNLAAQKEEYLKIQLEAFRSEKRKDPFMNPIAADLSDEDIANLAAYFASQKGAQAAQVGASEAGLDGKKLTFPKDYETTFTRYHRKDYDDRRQVRYFSGNKIALDAVAKGAKEFPNGSFLLVEIFAAQEDADGNLKKGADGKLVQGERKAFTAMEKQAGWGDDVPEIFKNGDFRHSVFQLDGSVKEGVNEALCLACHKPLTETDYTFTYKWAKDFLDTKKIGYDHKVVK